MNSGMNTWYRMAVDDGDPTIAEIDIYEEIGYWGVTARSFIRGLRDLGDVSTIYVNINSPGGDLFDGIAIYNVLKRHAAQVVVRVDALAASAASLIAMAGDVVQMPANAFIMIHNPWSWAAGNADELRETADLLDKFSGSLITAYMQKTGLPSDEIKALLDAESWLDAEEAVGLGFADEVIDAVSMAASVRRYVMARPNTLPTAHKERLMSEAQKADAAAKKTAEKLDDIKGIVGRVFFGETNEDGSPPRVVVATEDVIDALDVEDALTAEAEAKAAGEVPIAWDGVSPLLTDSIQGLLDNLAAGLPLELDDKDGTLQKKFEAAVEARAKTQHPQVTITAEMPETIAALEAQLVEIGAENDALTALVDHDLRSDIVVLETINRDLNDQIKALTPTPPPVLPPETLARMAELEATAKESQERVAGMDVDALIEHRNEDGKVVSRIKPYGRAAWFDLRMSNEELFKALADSLITVQTENHPTMWTPVVVQADQLSTEEKHKARAQVFTDLVEDGVDPMKAHKRASREIPNT